ncbi:MAG TPA: hypothetical protein VG962_04065 [Steroidobacteraceae bacterium]|nr:hypothetical protein [Steroidobacteraceae bacterium]
MYGAGKRKQSDVRLATQVQARTQQRAAATGQLNHCLLVVTHARNLQGGTIRRKCYDMIGCLILVTNRENW